MKKRIWKASILLMLSLVVTLMPANVYADYVYTSENVTVYNPAMVSYYWGWDQDWSVPYLTLSNGWHCSYTETLYAFTADSYRGRIGYCFSPGVIFTDQAGYYAKDDAYFQGAADQNPYLTKDELEKLTGLVMAAAYKGDLSQYYFEDESSGRDMFGHVWAGQILLWELVVGERDSAFNYIEPADGCSPCKAAIRSYSPIYGKFEEHYKSIESYVKRALLYPSFTSEVSRGPSDGFILKWNGHGYSADFEDKNGVLDDFSISTESDDIRITRRGDMLTVSSDVPLPSNETVYFTEQISSDNFVLFGSPGQNSFEDIKNDPYSYNQSLLFDKGNVTVEKNAYINVRTSPGEIRLSKVSSNCDMTDGNRNYSLEGAVYGVYTAGYPERNEVDESSFIGSIVTDAGGKGSILEGISAGRTYYIQEISAPKGYLLDRRVYTVIPEGTGENAAVVDSVEDPVNDPIAMTIEKRNAEEGKEISLEGTEFTFRYYDVDPDAEYTEEELEVLEPARTWIVKVKAFETEGKTVYRALLSDDYLAEGSDELYRSPGGEAILPAGCFTVKESKAADGFIMDSARYYSKGELISEDNRAVIGRLDLEGNIYPEGIDTDMIYVLNEHEPEPEPEPDPVPEPEPDPRSVSPKTGTEVRDAILCVVSLAVMVAYIDYEHRKEEADR